MAQIAEEKQIITSMISAKYKKNDTVKATEATALAIHDVSPEGETNMEQHLKNLIDQALKKKEKEKHTSTTPSSPPSNKKRKNSTGGKKPQSSLPQKEEGEPNTKKVSFRYPVTDTEEDTQNNTVKKKQKTSPKKNQPTLKKKQQSSKKKQPSKKNAKLTCLVSRLCCVVVSLSLLKLAMKHLPKLAMHQKWLISNVCMK